MAGHRSARTRATGALALLACLAALPAHALDVQVLGRDDAPLATFVDGNAVTLAATLAQPARRPTTVTFALDDGTRVAQCVVPRRERACRAGTLRTLGWHWTQGSARAERTVVAEAGAGSATRDRGAATVRVAARPVVLVHGFLSSHETWSAYTRDGGFLASIGVDGYAVGDGRADGAMNTGDPAKPTEPTRTLSENAATLGRYVAGVRRATGAEMVDLVAHSMGGLIARYYVARIMGERDVAQLVMLGSPHGGSDCSGLPSALGLYAPASLELRPAYVGAIFNAGISQRRGVPFHTLAGNPIVDAFKAPCTRVPSDMVVGQDSAAAIPGVLATMPVLHTEMTKSERAFRAFVAPRLMQGPGGFPDESDPAVRAESGVPAQFTPVASGRVPPGSRVQIDVALDEVAVASFALFDPSRSLAVTVRGASGREIALNASQHGLVRVDDPAAMVHLGYGFERPQPGPWKVTLVSTGNVAADYALSARVVGGAVLRAGASTPTPRLGDTVRFDATLERPGGALADVAMHAIVRGPAGKSERVDLPTRDARGSGAWRPAQAGLHGIDVVARARTPQGLVVERTAFLAVDVQP